MNEKVTELINEIKEITDGSILFITRGHYYYKATVYPEYLSVVVILEYGEPGTIEPILKYKLEVTVENILTLIKDRLEEVTIPSVKETDKAVSIIREFIKNQSLETWFKLNKFIQGLYYRYRGRKNE